MTSDVRSPYMLNALLDILFPKRCVGCRRSGTYLCPGCLKKIPAAPKFRDPDSFACLSYGHPHTKKLVKLLKYRGIRSAAEDLGHLLYGEHLPEGAIIVPIPLSTERLRERGYNQAELLARALQAAAPGGLELSTGTLLRIHHTAPQARIRSRRERLGNLRGAFAVADPSTIRGRTVVLVDDVATTGTTFAEAKKPLLEAGAARVICLAVAHG